jgi:hypothetical protein
MKRRWVTLGLAVMAPLTLVGAVTITGGTATAATPATITCSSLTTTISWDPPLVPGTATSKTTQIKFGKTVISGCTTSPSSPVTAATSVTATASKTTHGNSCSSLTHSSGAPTTYTFKVKWQGGGSSKVVFKGSHVVYSPSLGFGLSKGDATGSYPSKTANAEAFLSSSSAAAVSDCVAGSGGDVSSASVTSGNLSL